MGPGENCRLDLGRVFGNMSRRKVSWYQVNSLCFGRICGVEYRLKTKDNQQRFGCTTFNTEQNKDDQGWMGD